MSGRARSLSHKRIVIEVIPASLRIAILNTFILTLLLLITTPASSANIIIPVSVDDLLVVDCLLPGQIKRLGRLSTFVGARRPIKTTAND